MSVGVYTTELQLSGTAPAGPTLQTLPVTTGTLSIDRGWAPAVRAQFTVPYEAFDVASWMLIEPTLSAKFARLFVWNRTTGDQGLYSLNVRSYRFDVKSGTVEIVASSYEALVQDYGRVSASLNFTDTTAYPSTLSIVRALVQQAVGTDASPTLDWTAPDPAAPIPSNEFRFVTPGSDLWSHVQGLAQWTPGGIVQHIGYANDTGYKLQWLLTHPTYGITPSFAYQVPVEPGPDLGIAEGSAQLTEWQIERSREAEGWGDSMWLDYPNKQSPGSVTFTTSGYVMDYEYNLAGRAGSTSAKRRQAQAVSTPRSTPGPADRDVVADRRLNRVAFRAVQQTYTQALDTRLLPWQNHQDSNGVGFQISSVMHNIADGTSVVAVTRR